MKKKKGKGEDLHFCVSGTSLHELQMGGWGSFTYIYIKSHATKRLTFATGGSDPWFVYKYCTQGKRFLMTELFGALPHDLDARDIIYLHTVNTIQICLRRA